MLDPLKAIWRNLVHPPDVSALVGNLGQQKDAAEILRRTIEQDPAFQAVQAIVRDK